MSSLLQLDDGYKALLNLLTSVGGFTCVKIYTITMKPYNKTIESYFSSKSVKTIQTEVK